MRIVIIGAGNVAVNLAKALAKHNEIAQVRKFSAALLLMPRLLLRLLAANWLLPTSAK